MAGRGQELNTRITATDDASKVVDKVADKVGKLEDEEHEARLTADDQASDDVKRLDKRLDDLTDEEREAVLKVQAKNAQRELDTLNRKLARAEEYDDEEIALILNAKGNAQKKLDEIEQQLDEIQDGAGESGEAAGFELGTKLAQGFAAVGVGKLLLDAVNAAWERQDALNTITARFNLTAQDAERYGKLAGDLYADGWGESIPEVIDTVAAISERLEIENDNIASDLATTALVIKKVWGEEVDQTIRSIGQLMENDLVDSASEAADLIVAALQTGTNEAGDLFDTIDEYAQHFRAVGLDAADVLNILSAGIDAGQRDTDKIADAIKEMRIRIVEDSDASREALESIGLNADDIRDAFLEGGEAAKDAYLLVLEALEDVQGEGRPTADAIALIGTPIEDLGTDGIRILQELQGELGNVALAAEQAAEDVSEVSPWEEWKRDSGGALMAVGEGILKGWNAVDNALQDALGGTNAWIKEAMGEWSDATADAYGDVVAGLSGHYDNLAREQDAAAKSQERLAKRMAYGENAARNLAWANQELTDEVEDAEEAVDDLTDSFSDLRAEMSDRSAYLDAEDAVDDVRGAYRELIAAQEEYGTESEQAEAASRNMERALMDLKQDVIDYAAEVEGIPEQEITEILAMIDEGNLAGAEARLAALERDRVFRVKADTSGIPSWVRATNASGTTFYGAEGGIVTRPTMALIGEAGPEAVVPLNKAPGASPLPGGSGSGIGSSPGGDTYHIEVKTLAVDAEVERRLEQVIERIERKRKGMM